MFGRNPEIPGPVSAVRTHAELSEERNQKILQRKIIIHLDPTHSPARVIGCRQNSGDATALFQQVDLCTWRQINPAASRIAPKPSDRDQFTVAPTRKKCASRGIELDARKAKVERFVPARFVVPGIRQITECDPRRKLAGGAFEVELVPNHFAVGEGLRVIGAGDADHARTRQSARREKGRQQNRDSHPTILETRHAFVQCLPRATAVTPLCVYIHSSCLTSFTHHLPVVAAWKFLDQGLMRWLRRRQSQMPCSACPRWRANAFEV